MVIKKQYKDDIYYKTATTNSHVDKEHFPKNEKKQSWKEILMYHY